MPGRFAALKYALKLSIVPALARLGRLLGMSWQTLGDKLGREVMIAQAAGIRSQSAPDANASPSPLDVVFLTMIGGHSYNTSVDIVLGLALMARGHRVRFIICDQQLPVCEVKKASTEERWESSCAKCWQYAQGIYSAFGLEVIKVSQLINGRESTVDPSRWSEIVGASLLKHFGVGVLDDSPVVHERRMKYQNAAATSQAIGEALVDMKPDRVLMSHGIYSTWGPQRELLNEAGIPVVTFSKCKKLQTEKLNWTTGADWWDVSNEWERVRESPLTQSQQELLDTYLQSRRDHSADTLQYNFGAEESRAETMRRLGLDPDKPTFVSYTNVLWDASSAQREIVFDNPIQWIVETIRWFAAHPDRQLVVKIHPAEVVIGTNQPFASIIEDQIPELPENVRIIRPEEKVNSWSIMQIADLGLVHTSTIGMEMPLEGIPSAVVSKTHFRDRGFTIDVDTREEYFQLLSGFRRENYDTQQARELAMRYAFLLFERYQLPFAFFHEPRHTDVRAFNFASLNELVEHPVMQLIVNSIEQQTDFLLPEDPVEIEKFQQ